MNVVRQLRSRDDATPRVIVLCCARDGRPRLGPVVEQLAAHGHQVEVVSDVDTGVAGLLSTVQRRGAAALYVLFESPAFCGAAVSSLQLQLRTRGVPAHHVRVTPFDQTPVTQLSEELGPMSAQTQVPPPPPQVSRQGGNGPQLATAARPIDRSGAQPLVPPVDQSNRDIADAYTPMGSIKAGLRRTVGRSPLILAISIIGLAFVIAGSAFVILGGLDPQEVEVAAAATNPEPQAEPEAEPDPEPEPEPEPAPEAAPEFEAADHAAIVSADEADGQTEQPEGAEQSEGAEPTEAANAEDVPGDPDADPATDTPAPDSDVVTEEAPNPDDAEAVYEALANRKVRALDILLMAPEPVRTFKRRRKTYPKKMTWTDAEAYCRDLDIDGVRSWRLPTIGELSSLTTGRMMPSGKFWSRTKGDTFGQSRVVWNSDQQRMGPAPTSWKGGRVICVRTTIRPDEHPPEEE